MIGYRMVLTLYGKWLANVYRPNANLKLHERMQTKLYEKALQLDLASYDNTEFYNDFIWAIRESDTRAVKVLTDVCLRWSEWERFLRRLTGWRRWLF